ncbi:FtsX-like permease family protein [Hoyosella rhizosphaerae]|uniref:Permease n=1 Tax=Hoyosella rhizosphaerae TaxID=1755582 RepID=A0A916ULA7_9ACTN|nr:FtsX-like permease family protein [Hoyosella rhizosphaerae]MBN4925280.1 FtsX-like permease family protein [Hoyosella rhizosphaerae]GGC76552.1 permease [Hoyosella rhizosphaerae]
MRAAVDRWWLLHLRELWVRPVRAAISIGVIAVSSALIVAVLSTYGSLTGSVDKLSETIAGDADLEVTAITDTGFDNVVLNLVRRVDGVSAAVPMLWVPLTIRGENTLLFGSDASATALNSELAAVTQSQRSGLAQELLAGGVVAGPGLSVSVGDTLDLPGGEATVVEVVDSREARAVNNGNFLFTALPVAQSLSGRANTLDAVFVIADEGTDAAKLQTNIATAVDGRALVAAPEFRAAQAGTSIALTRDSTLIVAMIGLVVAGFLVFNSMNMTVAQRRPAIATLRALGSRRGTIVRGLIGESALIGFVGGLIGIPLGAVMGSLAVGRIPPVLIQSFSAEIAFVVQWYAPIIAVVLCVLASVAASAVAARQVFAVSPIEALQPADVVVAEGNHQPWTRAALVGGIAVMGIAVVMAFTFDDRRALLAGALFAAGGLAVSYGLIRPIGAATAHVASLGGAPGRLAAESAARAPRRVWATAVTVMIAVAVAVSTTGSMRNLVDSAGSLVESLADADFYVSTTPVDLVPSGPAVPAGVVDVVRTTPGVEQVTEGQWAYANISVPSAAPLKIMVLGAQEGTTAPAVRAMTDEMRRTMYRGDGIVLSRQLARQLGVEQGDTIDLATPSGLQQPTVVGVIDYLSVGAGMLAMPLPTMQDWYQRDGATFLEILVDDGTSVADVIMTIQPQIPDGVFIETGEQAYGAAQGATEQAGALAVGVQWIVAFVAAVALLNTLMLAVLDRRRELGVLRAMGASRKFVSKTVLVEALSVGVVGGALGLLFGSALHYLATVALSGTTAVHISFALVPIAGVYAVAALTLALLGAVVPAWRAGKMDIIRAVTVE